MRSLLIIFLLSISLLCEAQKKAQPQFIKFEEEDAHPEMELARHPLLYIGTTRQNLPLDAFLKRTFKEDKKLSPEMSKKEREDWQREFINMYYHIVVTDKKTFDLLHNFILKNSKFLFDKLHRPSCLIVIDNKSLYLPESNMKEFYQELRFELISKKCDTSMLAKIADQFTIPVEAPQGAQKLRQYYSAVSGYANNYLLFKDGSKMLWDDGIENTSYQTLLDKPDLKDMFDEKYEIGPHEPLPEKTDEPGRIRYEPFFEKIYGSTKGEVEKNLVTITWCPKLIGQKIMVTKVNGVDKKLEAISKELDEHPELKKYLTNIGGTFAWRDIAGTHRHSMHSFGMTIDLNTQYSDYWQWTCKCTNENADLKYQNRIPQVIVDIFEKHGFIWGGKWYHYDTMHFEYRPELLP